MNKITVAFLSILAGIIIGACIASNVIMTNAEIDGDEGAYTITLFGEEFLYN